MKLQPHHSLLLELAAAKTIAAANGLDLASHDAVTTVLGQSPDAVTELTQLMRLQCEAIPEGLTAVAIERRVQEAMATATKQFLVNG